MNCITTKNLNISYGNVDIVKDSRTKKPLCITYDMI